VDASAERAWVTFKIPTSRAKDAREMGHPAGRSGRPTQTAHTMSGFAVDFGPPPADADEEEAPVAEKFGGLAFEGVADELEDPSDDEEREGVEPEAMEEEAGDGDGQ